MARRLAMVMSQAPGLSGTPETGHCSSAATSASWASSSARPTSRTNRVRLAMIFAASSFQTASIARWVSVTCTMTAPPRLVRKPGRYAGPGSGAEDLLDDALAVADDLPEAPGEFDGLLLGPDLHQCEAGDGLTCLGERSVGHGDLAA